MLAASDPDAARERGQRLAAALDRELGRYIEERWRVRAAWSSNSRNCICGYFCRAPAIARAAPASAMRAWLDGADGTVEFVGMEVVRRDWTALAKQVQRELYQRLFTDQSVDVYLKEVVGR